MRRCMNCGITSGIKNDHHFCHACGGNKFETTTSNKNQDLVGRVSSLEKRISALEEHIREPQCKATARFSGSVSCSYCDGEDLVAERK